jgi:hypothetical protein
MRTLISFAIAFLLSCPLISSDLVQVEGNRFVDPQGETVVFLGVNSSDPDKLEREGQWNQRYFKAVADWGSNVIRFPVHPKAWRERSPEEYLKLLDSGVKWAEQNDLYVIIDWHSIGNLLEEKFQSQMYETDLKETLEFWKTIAKRYAGDTTVAFYELYNEPTISGFGEMTWGQWKAAQERMIRAIRQHDRETVVLVAGFDWAYDLKPVADDPFEEKNLAYVSHPYPQKREQPWEEKWEEDWGFVADRYPVILTEIGFCLEKERGAHIPVISTEEYGRSITSYSEKKGISWVAWVFDTRWSPMLILDWEFTPSTQGKFFRDYLRSKK